MNAVIKKTTLTTTLALLREHGACVDGYKKLKRSLGAKWPDDKAVSLLTVLDSNGVNDMLWCLRATKENCDKVARLMAADFAESVLHHFAEKYPNDNRPALAIKAARDFANGKIDDASRSASRSAAYLAAYLAAYSAADSAEKEKQTAIIKKWLK